MTANGLGRKRERHLPKRREGKNSAGFVLFPVCPVRALRKNGRLLRGEERPSSWSICPESGKRTPGGTADAYLSHREDSECEGKILTVFP